MDNLNNMLPAFEGCSFSQPHTLSKAISSLSPLIVIKVMLNVKGQNVGLQQQPQKLAKSSFTSFLFFWQKRHREPPGSGLTTHINVCACLFLCTYFVMTDDTLTGEGGLSVRNCLVPYACSAKTSSVLSVPVAGGQLQVQNVNTLRTQWGHSWPNHSGHVHVICHRRDHLMGNSSPQ